MRNNNYLRTIIRHPACYVDHPWFVLSPSLVEIFFESAARIGISTPNLNRALVAFDCFLHINNVEYFNEQSLGQRREYFIDLVEGFIGALHSSDFSNLSAHSRYNAISFFRATLIEMRREFNVPICDFAPFAAFEESISKLLDIRISSKQQTPFVLKCISKFEALPPFNEEAIYIWRGWPATNLTGRTAWLRLYPMYKRLGRKFTDAFYEQCCRYYEARRSSRVPALNSLARFIGEFPEDLQVSDLQSPDFITKFWPKFLIFYITTGDEEGISLPIMSALWRTEFIFFANEFLVATGLFAEGYGPIPAPPARSGPDLRTNIRKNRDGIEVHAKLLVHIPLQVNDAEAMRILFYQLQDHVDLLLQWARASAQDLWARSTRRKEEAKIGIARERIPPNRSRFGTGWLIANENPDRYKNACAAYEAHGHLTRHDEIINLMYPVPLADTVHYLGLPTVGSLLPHLTILVATHPAITTSFLEHLEVYDKNGHDCCLVEIDGATILRSSKGRKGPRLSWQEISLTAETAEIVRQLIAITAPLRDYLKACNDDNWRYLLLTCEKGLGYPSRITRIASDTSTPHRVQATAQGMHLVSGRPLEACQDVANCFSLSTLRATVGVLVYINTKDAKKMSEALGHTAYERGLLARYLPEEILAFFQERWVRIFQTSMIVDALKDSDYILPASGFKNIHELDEFLSNHTFKKVPGAISEDENAARSSTGKVLFGLDVSVLTALLSLQMSVRQAKGTISATAKYWDGIGTSLVKFIDSESCDRDDMRYYLQMARKQANPSTMAEIIYED